MKNIAAKEEEKEQDISIEPTQTQANLTSKQRQGVTIEDAIRHTGGFGRW